MHFFGMMAIFNGMGAGCPERVFLYHTHTMPLCPLSQVAPSAYSAIILTPSPYAPYHRVSRARIPLSY